MGDTSMSSINNVSKHSFEEVDKMTSTQMEQPMNNSGKLDLFG